MSISSVNGNILSITESSVRCEVIVLDASTIIILPLSLFSNDIYVGYPFTLSVELINDEICPKIEKRELDFTRTKQLRDEIYDILDKLEKLS